MPTYQNDSMKLIITGGHHTSAIPVIDELKLIDSSLEIAWVGHKYSMAKDTNLSAEFSDITDLGIPFYDINAGKFYHVYNPLLLLKIFAGFVNAFILLLKLKPDGVLSFGGYIAVPVCLSACFLGIPTVTHEQTVVYGYANKLISHFVKKIFVSSQKSLNFFPKEKAILTGIPIRKEILTPSSNEIIFEDKLPVLYITGGKQGSHFINDFVKEVLPKLLVFTNVIHQCGSSSVFNDFDVLYKEKESLPTDLKKRYLVYDYINLRLIGEVYNKADLVISRSGAHTVHELLALQKPAILIPISWVSHNEQVENAKLLENAGLATVVGENEISGEVLLQKIRNVLENISGFKVKDGVNFGLNKDSAKFIANETYKTLFGS